MKRQHGFTLVELMIVIAIVGVLMSMALPAYQNYVNKSKLAEVMAFAIKPKAQITEFYSTNGTMPTVADSGRFNLGTDYSDYINDAVLRDEVAAATDGGGGGITLGITAEVVPGEIITVDLIARVATDNSGVEWRCVISEAAIDYAPSNCNLLSASTPPSGSGGSTGG